MIMTVEISYSVRLSDQKYTSFFLSSYKNRRFIIIKSTYKTLDSVTLVVILFFVV